LHKSPFVHRAGFFYNSPQQNTKRRSPHFYAAQDDAISWQMN
jgi:hypothetical protein